MATDMLELEKIRLDVDKICAPWKDRPGNLIMVLHAVQKKYSYVPRRVSFEVAKTLDIPLARIYEVITFFNYFKLEAPGKHVVSVCMGTACYLKGAGALVQEVHSALGIRPGGNNAGQEFSPSGGPVPGLLRPSARDDRGGKGLQPFDAGASPGDCP